ncbi:glucan 1,3-beta-glucosidase [Thozetella sp. PMI_491]|nr:glucan 1,3-beta-glucosidase [Thozetella sp. PMI_491]
MKSPSLLSIALFAASALAQNKTGLPTGILGFNSGAMFDNSKAKEQSDFEAEFKTAQKLHGSPGLFTSVRLYSNVQWNTKSDPISAFPAAIATNTTMLLGIWCSGTTTISDELKALQSAISKYGQQFTDLVVGISVGSEDLYRTSESGIANKAGVGQGPETIVSFISDVRKAIAGTSLANKPVGHVDSWSAWANGSNKAVVEEVDFLGVDLYPYYEKDKGNTFANSTNVYDYIYGLAEDAAAGKPLWITETGWPASGPTFGAAEASTSNAATYWQNIGCGKLFGRSNVWWYNLRDSNPDNQEKFAITDNLSLTPKFNLSCAAGSGAPAAINLDSGAGTTAPGMVKIFACIAAGIFVLVGLF